MQAGGCCRCVVLSFGLRLDTDDKKRGRLNLITHLLSQLQYTPVKPKVVKFPKRQARGSYRDPDLSALTVPTLF